MTSLEVGSSLARLKELAKGPGPVESSWTVAEQTHRTVQLKDVTQRQLAYAVAAAYDVFQETGKLEPAEDIWQRHKAAMGAEGISKQAFVALWLDQGFLDAIYLRGIRHQDNGLNGRMLLALSELTNPHIPGTPLQRLKRIGVKAYEHEAWLNYPPYRTRLMKMSEKVLQNSVGGSKVALARLAQNGELNAIKYLFEVTGEHDPNKQQIVDVQKVIQGMAEIMMTYIKNPDQLREAAGKISILLATNGLDQS